MYEKKFQNGLQVLEKADNDGDWFECIDGGNWYVLATGLPDAIETSVYIAPAVEVESNEVPLLGLLFGGITDGPAMGVQMPFPRAPIKFQVWDMSGVPVLANMTTYPNIEVWVFGCGGA